jgi:2-polyprenyl-6-methoxyphenol hydroxylase-like FAD-dependent oxidoreductase
MKVLIVGGGIGGLTLGAFLEESDIEYEIVEKAKDWNHQGYVVAVWDNGRDILRKLGLAEQLDIHGMRIKTLSLKNGRGLPIKTYKLSNLYKKYGTACTNIKRSDLHNWLASKIDPTKLKMGISVEKLLQRDNKIHSTFTDGRVGEYDVVIGADGVHSIVRELLLAEHVEKYENWRIWCAWIDDKFSTPATITEYLEPSEFAMVFSSKEGSMVWFAAPVEHVVWDTPEGRVERLRYIFKDEPVLVPGVLESLHPEDITPTDLLMVKMKQWVNGNAVLLGDAAHSFGPHAGLGCSMAMEDAYVLAAELCKVSETFSVQKALQAYEKKRRVRIHLAEKLSYRIRFATRVKSRIARAIINFFVPHVPDHVAIGEYDKLLRQEI